MKKILAILFAIVLITSVFVACSKTPDTEEEPTTNVVDVIAEAVEDEMTVESVTTDEDGNDVIVGTDEDGNTVELKTDTDGNVTKTVTDKTTGHKTEVTTQVATTKASSSGTTKSSGTTAKTASASTTKASSQSTTKAASQSTTKSSSSSSTATKTSATTAHVHNYSTPVYSTRQVLVSEAYDEPEYKKEMHLYCSGCKFDLTEYCKKVGIDICNGQMIMMGHLHDAGGFPNPYNAPQCTSPLGAEQRVSAVSGDYWGDPVYIDVPTGNVIHHDAVYKTEKYISGYKCSCGATKAA